MKSSFNCLERTLKIESENLSPYACKSVDTLGRKEPIDKDILRTEFQRDRDRIVHCKSFRRLMHKTQVFFSPQGDHYRTRLTHTLEVTQIARSIARSLRLNEDLAEAIALGHDLGHAPFGHAGESALHKMSGFMHANQSLRVIDYIENDGKGLNLTYEVRDGVKNHTSKGNSKTLEGHIVSWSDRIAYLNHDIDDAMRAGLLKLDDIPSECREAFGDSGSSRINNMIVDIINNCTDKNHVSPSDEFVRKINTLRTFMFENVYHSDVVIHEEKKVFSIVEFLYEYFYKNIDKVPRFILNLDSTKEEKVCDYVSMMTDKFAINLFTGLAIPRSWSVI